MQHDAALRREDTEESDKGGVARRYEPRRQDAKEQEGTRETSDEKEKTRKEINPREQVLARGKPRTAQRRKTGSKQEPEGREIREGGN